MHRDKRNILGELRDGYGAVLEYRVASDSWKFRGKPLTPASLTKILANDLAASNQVVANAMERYAFDQYEASEDTIRAWLTKIERQPCADRALRDWLEQTQHARTTDTEHEAHVHALKQWIWQCKRGIAGQKVTWHVAPIIWCRMNGTGKTFNLHRLVEPLYQFTRELKVEELDEKFSGKMLARTLVVVLDEFEGCTPTQVPVIKSILTGKPFDRRGMMSESGFHAENRISCIATSNKEPPHGFYDESGARRFWSIHSREEKVLPGTSRALFYDNCDIEAVWACVRVTDDAPTATMDPELSRFMDEVRDAKLRSKSSLEAFILEWCEPRDGVESEMGAMLDAYKRYCEQTGLSRMRLTHAKARDKFAEHGYQVSCHARYYQVVGLRLKEALTIRG